ncbi:MAG: TraB/GumN family protein [Methanomassiliicoccaceae archaeon]|nr:TraB/GumN family protein [Methanomassiliicoccaceae archaeon]
MITLVGTGHVFKIAEQVKFIVRNIWPDAVLVELDASRYGAITADAVNEENNNSPWAYRKMAKYQRRMAEEYDSQVGSEFIAAVETGRTLGAAVEFIDKDAGLTMTELWNEMPFRERMRFTLSLFGDRFRRRKADILIQEFAENEEEYFGEMRKKYPTLVRKLIDERNAYMSERIKEALKRHESIVVVIGDGHVEGIARSLEEETDSIRKIRLKTLMDKESMDSLRAELWSGPSELDE